MLRSIFFVVGSMISNHLLAGLLHNTAQPMARNLIRKGVKFTARVFTVCLIGALIFVSGLIIGVMDLANQLVVNGFVFMSPHIWFAMGMILLGMVFIYVGAYSDLLSPWRKMNQQDLREASKEDRLMNHFFEGFTAWARDKKRASAKSKNHYEAHPVH